MTEISDSWNSTGRLKLVGMRAGYLLSFVVATSEREKERKKEKKEEKSVLNEGDDY